jgi:hypothetical protein
MSDTEARITHIVQTVERDEASFGVLSTAEQIAVAFVLNRVHLLEGYTILEAVERLGPGWTRAALAVQRALDVARPDNEF